MTTETNAVAMNMIDRLIQRDDANAAAWRAENAAIIAAMRARADEAIQELIETATDEPLTRVLSHAALFEDGSEARRAQVTRRATIEADGLAPITITATADDPDRPGRVRRIGTEGNSDTGADAPALDAAIIAARRAWLAAEEQRQAQEARERADEELRNALRARRIAADDAALEAWAPAYDAYCADLAQRARHNAAIVAPLANDLSRQPFDARRLTYAIVYGDGIGQATTEVTWVTGDNERAAFVEIDNRGQIEPMFFYHPVSVTPPRTYTAREIDEAVHGSARSFTGYPPIRIGTYCDGISRWRVVAAPAAESIEATIDRAIRTAGATLHQPPAMPETPAVSSADRLRTLAEEIERRHLTEEERQTLRRHLADSIEIPF